MHYICIQKTYKKNSFMAIPMTNIPVLTGKVAERFVEQCEYNAKHLAGSQWSQEREDRFNAIIEKFNKRKVSSRK